jgi:hypothetical protein
MRSADGGRTWAATSAHLPPTAIYQWSCADGLHCMLLTTSRRIAITTTSDGGVSWRTTVSPPSWPNTAIDVSCATGLDCFISASDWVSTVRSATGNGAYLHPVIEATYDGGSTWTSLSLPRVGRFPLALVSPLSCPSPAGCIGAATTDEQEGVSSRREIISSFPSG